MVKHVIIWTLKENFSEKEKENIKVEIKEGLEGLKDKIPGLMGIKVYTDGLSSSNGDLMLDSMFKDRSALSGYAIHPEHVAVADNKVRPYVKIRSCFDYEV